MRGLRSPFSSLRAIGAGFGDPTLRVGPTEALRATRTPEGPATLRLACAEGGAIETSAWGEGAEWALAHAGDWLGAGDTPPDWLPAGARAVCLPRTSRVFELLVPIVLEQLVSGAEASRAFARLVRRFSERAPGPFDDLWLPLGPGEIRAIPMAAFPACGALQRQGATLHELARRATRVEEAATMDAGAAERRLTAFPGVGIWTARNVMLRGMGFADAVPLGDYGLPSVVAYNLAGEERADDARMLELLEPYRGQRGRVVRWIEMAGRTPPRRGARAALRTIEPEARSLLRGLR